MSPSQPRSQSLLRTAIPIPQYKFSPSLSHSLSRFYPPVFFVDILAFLYPWAMPGPPDQE